MWPWFWAVKIKKSLLSCIAVCDWYYRTYAPENRVKIDALFNPRSVNVWTLLLLADPYLPTQHSVKTLVLFWWRAQLRQTLRIVQLKHRDFSLLSCRSCVVFRHNCKTKKKKRLPQQRRHVLLSGLHCVDLLRCSKLHLLLPLVFFCVFLGGLQINFHDFRFRFSKCCTHYINESNVASYHQPFLRGRIWTNKDE